MHLALREGFGSIDEVAVVHPELAHHESAYAPTERSIYGQTRRRPNWVAIALIVLLHAGALLLLTTLDIISLPKLKHEPMVVILLPQLKPPPPTAPQPKPTVKTPPSVVDAPAPIVPVIQPVATVFTPPPPPKMVQPEAPVAAPTPAKPVSIDLDAATAAGTPPTYPIESRRRREQGTVRLRLVIGTDGRVKEISVASSSGFDRLDKAALDAVRRWRFQPQMQAGVAVEAVGTLPIPFRLT
jgi:protein TonB